MRRDLADKLKATETAKIKEFKETHPCITPLRTRNRWLIEDLGDGELSYSCPRDNHDIKARVLIYRTPAGRKDKKALFYYCPKCGEVSSDTESFRLGSVSLEGADYD